jgi:hypothetical protein
VSVAVALWLQNPFALGVLLSRTAKVEPLMRWQIMVFIFALVLVLGGGLLAVGGLLLARKVFDFEKLRASHDVGSVLIAIVGTLYSVLLGLIVVDAMQQYQRARDTTERETNNLVDVFILAKAVSEPQRSQLQKMCTDYADQVVRTEWELMRQGTYCPLSRQKAVDLMSSLMDFEPKTQSEQLVYPKLVDEASQFWQNRASRISMAENGMPAIEWAVLIAGALITVSFTYFFVLEHLRLQILMTSMVAMLISLNLTLLLLFAYPFSGELAVQNGPFNSVQKLFSSVDSGGSVR